MSNVRFILEKYFLRLLMLRNPINRPKEVNDRATYRRGRNVKMRISFTSVRRDGIIRAVAICKSVLPDNIIYIYMYLYVYTFMYTHVYEHIIRCNQRYALSSSSSSSFTLMLFVPDERNFLSSIQITRIYTHNDGTIN